MCICYPLKRAQYPTLSSCASVFCIGPICLAVGVVFCTNSLPLPLDCSSPAYTIPYTHIHILTCTYLRMHTHEQHFQRYYCTRTHSDRYNYKSTVHACVDTAVDPPIHLQQTHSCFLTTPHPYGTTSQCHPTLSPPLPVTPPPPTPLPSGQVPPVLSGVGGQLCDPADLTVT